MPALCDGGEGYTVTPCPQRNNCVRFTARHQYRSRRQIEDRSCQQAKGQFIFQIATDSEDGIDFDRQLTALLAPKTM